ncbi:hypothetical protein H1C71_021149, partial [Ictidomys tridecemlineatus]
LWGLCAGHRGSHNGLASWPARETGHAEGRAAAGALALPTSAEGQCPRPPDSGRKPGACSGESSFLGSRYFRGVVHTLSFLPLPLNTLRLSPGRGCGNDPSAKGPRRCLLRGAACFVALPACFSLKPGTQYSCGSATMLHSARKPGCRCCCKFPGEFNSLSLVLV